MERVASLILFSKSHAQSRLPESPTSTAASELCLEIFEVVNEIIITSTLSMLSPKIVLYQPNAEVRSRRIDVEDWEKHRPRLEELYIKDDKKLEEVMEIVALYNSFHAR